MQAFGNINSRRLQSSQCGASTLPAAPTSACPAADASLWLALRAGVLRRAACSSGTALRAVQRVRPFCFVDTASRPRLASAPGESQFRLSTALQNSRVYALRCGTAAHSKCKRATHVVHQQLARCSSSSGNLLIIKFAPCRLTIRSTGPIAAGQHLGYKSLAQIPAHHNRPVSSNVMRLPSGIPSSGKLSGT